MAFAPGEPPPDQIIRLAHFTADEAVSMDPTARDDPDEKLAGVQMGHFAAFLKRSWRANDWMWGRSMPANAWSGSSTRPGARAD